MKSTQEEIARRVEEILKIRLLGAEFHDIREYACEKGWNVSDTQLRRYVEKTNELLAAAREPDREKLIARHLMQRRVLYARAVESGDLRGALAIAKDEAELEGLYAPSKPIQVDVTSGGKPFDLDTLTAADIAAAAALWAAAGFGVQTDRGAEPLDSPPAASEATDVPVI